MKLISPKNVNNNLWNLSFRRQKKKKSSENIPLRRKGIHKSKEFDLVKMGEIGTQLLTKN